ncbi:ERI1 exoribonuclease 3 [Copidosoma floridanum]|uniref:ERI1 exoribonuclease 3 n=1 Tax=Copidosoma floridanum TaxID=29053 RepID=UPI0006C9DAEF|nr:ERI1 exoribonuclease 3 [Copidosoma floridanum]
MAHRALMRLGKQLPKRVNEYKPFQNFLVLDFEATCEANKILKPQEIIEIPCFAVSSEDWHITDVFHEYVKPRVHPQLSTYCSTLTGLMQETLDDEDFFPVVFSKFCEWIKNGNYFDEEGKSAFVTCGDWDLKVMLPEQCKLDNIEVPSYFKEWINLKTTFCSATNYYPRGINDMLKHFNMKFQGRNHCGLDDAHNITRLMRVLAERNRPQFIITSNVKDKKFDVSVGL